MLSPVSSNFKRLTRAGVPTPRTPCAAGCNCHLCWTQFVDADPGVVTRGKTNVWRGINRARDKKKRKLGFPSPVPNKDESRKRPMTLRMAREAAAE